MCCGSAVIGLAEPFRPTFEQEVGEHHMPDKGLYLGVNIDHIATLRQVRGTTYPDPLEAAEICMQAGADGITVHLREDRRHIQDADVYALRERCTGVLNLEMANAPGIVLVALDVLPDEVCIVPEKREELTTEGGLDVAGQQSAVGETTARLKEAGIAVSLFIEGDERQIRASAACGADYVELHTGTYCDLTGERAEIELLKLVEAACLAQSLGLRVNAGHGINRANIPGILKIPHLHTLNIGHSIVARAVVVGLACAVREMIDSMSPYAGGEL